MASIGTSIPCKRPESRMPQSAPRRGHTRTPDVSADGCRKRTLRMLPLIAAVLTALAFAASAWFFYHQGHERCDIRTAARRRPASTT